MIARVSNLLTNIVGCGVCIRQANVKWSKQGGVGAVEGVLGDVIKKGSEGWLWRRMRGHDWLWCQARRSKLNLSKSVDIAHIAQPENERRASVFFTRNSLFYCVHGKALQVPYLPANSEANVAEWLDDT